MHSLVMSRCSIYDGEIRHLRNLLDTVSSDEENIKEYNGISYNDEQDEDDNEFFSDHE